MPEYEKIALIAGAGQLPHAVLRGVKAQGIKPYVAAVTGFSSASDFDAPSGQFRLGELAKLIETLKAENVQAVSFAGIVERPNFANLRPDLGTLKYMPGLIKAAAKGDDALLSHVTHIFEQAGMVIIGPQELCSSLLAQQGVLGVVEPQDHDNADIEKARQIAKSIGAMDIGQGAVVHQGLVLAVEAQEGTDRMLSRVASLRAGPPEPSLSVGGVLAKMVKPGQEERLDLPTIGLKTVEGAIQAGLAGIAIEAGRAFILDKEQAITRADEAGLFIIALSPAPYHPYDGRSAQ